MLTRGERQMLMKDDEVGGGGEGGTGKQKHLSDLICEQPLKYFLQSLWTLSTNDLLKC